MRLLNHITNPTHDAERLTNHERVTKVTRDSTSPTANTLFQHNEWHPTPQRDNQPARSAKTKRTLKKRDIKPPACGKLCAQLTQT